MNVAPRIDVLRQHKRRFERKFGRVARPLQFGAIGASGMIVDLSSFAVLLQVITLGAARAGAILVAMTWNFWLNRRLTFSYARHESVFRQYVLFCVACGSGAIVNWIVSMTLLSFFEAFADAELLAAFLGIAAGAVLNYVFCSRIVFRRSRSAVASHSAIARDAR